METVEVQDEKKPVKKSRGVALVVREWEQLDEIADELGMTPHKVAAYALRDFLRRYSTGDIQTKIRRILPDQNIIF